MKNSILHSSFQNGGRNLHETQSRDGISERFLVLITFSYKINLINNFLLSLRNTSFHACVRVCVFRRHYIYEEECSISEIKRL